MATETIDIRIREDGSRVVKRNIEDIGNSSEKAASGVDMLKRALGALAGVLAIDQIRRYADAWASAAGQIRVATRNTEEAAAVTDKLFRAAQNTRQGFTNIVELYSRTARAGKELGVSQEQLIGFTENVGKVLASSATTAEQAQGALMQLGQALGSGVVRAEEFNSILEGAPAILQVVANNIKGADGSIGQLRKMMLDGKLTSREFFDAIMAGTDQINSDFAKSSITISQGMTLISNAFMKWIGEMDASLGISNKLGEAAKWLAENFDLVAKSLISVAAGFVLVQGGVAAINAVRAAVLALNAAIAANPIGFLLVLITSAITALTLFRDQIKLGTDDVTSLGDLMRAVWESAVQGFKLIADWAERTFGPAIDMIKSWVGEVDISLVGILRLVAKAVDTYYGAWFGVIKAVIALFKGLPAAMGDLFTQALNVILGKIGNFVNAAGQLLSSVTEFAGLGKIATVDLQLTNENKGAAAQLGKDVGTAFMDGFNSVDYAQRFLEDRIKRAQEIGRERAAREQAGGADLSNPLGQLRAPGLDAKELEKQRKELEKLKNELRSLLNTIAPVEGAKLEMAKAEETLNKAVAKGLITTQDQARYLELLKAHYQDAIDPLGKINREIDEQTSLLGLNNRERQIQQQMMQYEKELKSQGIILNEQETASLRAKLEAMQRLNEVVAAQDSLLQNSVQTRQNFATQIEAIKNLLANPSSGFTSADATNALMNSVGSDLFAGTQEQINAQLASLQNMYLQIDQMRQADLISEQTAAQMKAKVNVQAQQIQLQNAQSFFGNLATLSRSENKKIAAIGKAAAITQATIDGVLAVQKALASAPPPANYALAAAAGVAAAANVASIVAQNVGFMTGGSFKVGGSGGADSQMVAFRASPGETVSVATPTQVRKGTDAATGNAGGGAAQPALNARIINVVDPALVGDYLSTPEGEEVIMNVMRRNSDQTRAILNGG